MFFAWMFPAGADGARMKKIFSRSDILVLQDELEAAVKDEDGSFNVEYEWAGSPKELKYAPVGGVEDGSYPWAQLNWF